MEGAAKPYGTAEGTVKHGVEKSVGTKVGTTCSAMCYYRLGKRLRDAGSNSRHLKRLRRVGIASHFSSLVPFRASWILYLMVHKAQRLEDNLKGKRRG